MSDQSAKAKNDQKAYDFLKQIRPQGMMNVVSFHPVTGHVSGVTANIDDPKIHDFISRKNSHENLYWMVNEPSIDAPDTKLKKEHVERLHALYIDIDPAKDKDFDEQRIQLLGKADKLAFIDAPPSVVVDSGGGIQAFWFVDKPVPVTKETQDLFESLNRGLANDHQSDSVHNIDRVMRLPFTINIPDEKKKKYGRKPSMAKTLWHNNTIYSRGQILKDITTPLERMDNAEVTTTDYDMTTLMSSWSSAPELKAKIDKLRKTDKLLNDFYNGEIKKPSRSEYDFFHTTRLKQAGFTLDEVAQALYLSPHGKGKEIRPREIQRCYQRAENPFEMLALSPEMIKQIESIPKPSLESIQASRDYESNSSQSTSIASIREKLADAIKSGLPNTHLTTHEGGSMDYKASGQPMFKNLLDLETFNVLYGASNVGKSFVALDLAGHLATGKDWAGYKNKAGKMSVLYIAAEAGHSFGKRLKGLKEHLSISDNASLTEFPFRVITDQVNILNNEKDILAILIEAERLKRDSQCDVGLIIVDTLATTFAGGNENSSEDMGLYITNTKTLQSLAKSAIITVHHAGKNEASGARGHSSLKAATDTEVEVNATLYNDKWKRSLTTTKQRDGESHVTTAFGLNVVELYTDEDGDVITTCHVVTEDDPSFNDLMPSILDTLDPTPKGVYNIIKFMTNYDIEIDITLLSRVFYHALEGSQIVNDHIIVDFETGELTELLKINKQSWAMIGGCVKNFRERRLDPVLHTLTQFGLIEINDKKQVVVL